MICRQPPRDSRKWREIKRWTRRAASPSIAYLKWTPDFGQVP